MTIFLETKRLIIKAPELNDIEKIYLLDSDPDVMRYIGNGLPRSKEESYNWYVKSVQYYKKYKYSFGLVYEKETGEFVGRAGINHNAYDDSQTDIEIGYRLLKKFWNKGYATELAAALVQWGFQNLKLEKICGFAIPENTSSRHVLEKVGMKLIGHDKYTEEDVVRYEILKTDFRYSNIKSRVEDMPLSITAGKAEDRDYINDQIVKFNAEQVPFTQSEKFINIDYVVKDGQKLVGGITAILYCWKCLYIDVLWVEEDYRHQGLGAQLLKKVEEEAIKSGCHLSHLDTFDFQAKEFYLKNGYEVFGELKDCPMGHSRFYLNKLL